MQEFRVSGLVDAKMNIQIGRVCVAWSMLELTVERLIWHLSGIGPKQGRKLTAKEDIAPRLKRLKKLAKKLPLADAKEIRGAITQIDEAKKKRNFVVHGLSGIDVKNKLHAISYRDDIKGRAIRADVVLMRKIRGDIIEAQKRLEKLLPIQ